MAEICSDLAVLDINRPAPFDDPEIAKAWCHVQVFGAAEYLEARTLCEFTSGQLITSLNGLHSCPRFHELVERTLNLSRRSSEFSTPMLAIVNECAENITYLFNDGGFHRLLQTDHRLAFLVLSKLVEKQQRSGSTSFPGSPLTPRSQQMDTNKELKSRLLAISNEVLDTNGTALKVLSMPFEHRSPEVEGNQTSDAALSKDKLTRRLMELKAEIMDLGEKLEEKRKSDRELRTELQQRDLEIKKTEQDKSALKGEIKSYIKQLTDATQAKVVADTDLIKPKEEQVRKLTAEVEHLKNHIEAATRHREVLECSKKADDEAKDAEIHRLEQRIKVLEEGATSRKRAHKEQTRLLTRQLESKDVEAQTTQNALAKREAEVRDLQTASQKKTRQIQELQASAQRFAAQRGPAVSIKDLQATREALAKRDAELFKLQGALKRKNETIKALQTAAQKVEAQKDLTQLGKKLSVVQQTLNKNKDDEIRGLQEELKRRKQQIKSLEARAQTTTRQMSALSTAPATPTLMTPLGLQSSRYATPSDSVFGVTLTPQSGIKIDQAVSGAAQHGEKQSENTPSHAKAAQNGLPSHKNASGSLNPAVEAQLAKVIKERDFFRNQLSEFRLGNTPARSSGTPSSITYPTRANLAAGSDMSAATIKKKYDDALQLAGKEYKGCNDCGVPFYSQFRGAPEDPSARHLAMNCTKCGVEQMRWAL